MGLLLIDGRRVARGDGGRHREHGAARPGRRAAAVGAGRLEPMLRRRCAGARWRRAAMALLDPRVASALRNSPEVTAVIVDRLNDRSHRLATTQAISQVNRVDRRLLALFWHLAERWGRVTAKACDRPHALAPDARPAGRGAAADRVGRRSGELARARRARAAARRHVAAQRRAVDPPDTETERIVPIRRGIFGRQGREALPGGVD